MSFTAASSKTLLAFIPLLILPYSFNTQALSATTANTIQGTAPYLTFDGGTTKVTTTDGLLSIKLSDGTIPTPNSTTPIVLPVAGETFADIEMLVPAITPPVSASDPTQSINLNALIGAPYNYGGDDDGDGQGTSGITATGSLSVVITDKNGTKVNRSDIPTVCGAPYKVVLSSTAGSLSTQYGDPSSSAFTAANATYYINPVASPTVCFAKPDMTSLYAGPASMWNPTKGFIPQSTSPATYGSNFPTTGANGLYFDLDIGGVDATTLTWAGGNDKGITVAIDPTFTITPTTVRYKLTGPTAAIPPSPFNTDGATLELTGSTGGTKVVKYGFTIKKWYVNRGATLDTQAGHKTWCSGRGYRLTKLSDLTNASIDNAGDAAPGATPGSGGTISRRRIVSVLIPEWGNLGNYPGSGFYNYWYMTSDTKPPKPYYVTSNNGGISANNFGPHYGTCVYP